MVSFLNERVVDAGAEKLTSSGVVSLFVLVMERDNFIVYHSSYKHLLNTDFGQN